MRNIIDRLKGDAPLFVILKDQSVAKITRLTVRDDYNDALYEVLSTAPNQAHRDKKSLSFVHHSVVEEDELSDFLNSEFSSTLAGDDISEY